MTGFRVVALNGLDVLVNDGPADAAVGRITGESAAALWTRQVLSDGRLRAVVLNSSADDFIEVHRTAERVAAGLGVSAVDVAVWPADSVFVTDAAGDDLAAGSPGDDTVLLAAGTDPSVAPTDVRPASALSPAKVSTP